MGLNDTIERTINFNIRGAVDASLAGNLKQLQNLDGKRINVKVDADTSSAETQINKISANPVKVPISGDFAQFHKDVRASQKIIDAERTRLMGLEQEAYRLERKLDKFDSATASSREVEKLANRIDELSEKAWTLKEDLSDDSINLVAVDNLNSRVSSLIDNFEEAKASWSNLHEAVSTPVQSTALETVATQANNASTAIENVATKYQQLMGMLSKTSAIGGAVDASRMLPSGDRYSNNPSYAYVNQFGNASAQAGFGNWGTGENYYDKGAWHSRVRGGKYNVNAQEAHIIYVDQNGNVSFSPYSSPIKALPAGSSNDEYIRGEAHHGGIEDHTDEIIDFLENGGSSGGGNGGGSGGSGDTGLPQLGKQKGFFENVLGTSLGKYITRLATYQMVSGAIYGTVQAFKDALGTMKEVDSELASIQKVTDFTADQMAEIEEGAYSVASQYGVSAQEYLESVSAFAKAGYKDLADDLGELAIKTQLVGDVTAETANKFLLAVDAAWKMGGSTEDLSRVLDEANVVENNYATSIDKLAQGMPNVASVASMAGMSAEETIAALGTITAVTQQSGTKASTALRALILNIMKDTTTEVEEGVTVTKEQISTLDEVLQTYAYDAIQAAQATGEIVNPMEVVAALAKAYQENKISDRDLAKIEMALGGKLRTNQLDALLKNFGMYEEMMGKIAESAGSADKEIGIMLDTWEAKAKILKNTWTEFVSKTISTDIFKGMLDGATKLLKVIGDLGTVLEAVGGILAAKFFVALPEFSVKLAASIANIGTLIKGLGAGGIAGGITAIAALAATGTLIGIQRYRKGLEDAATTAAETAKASAQQRDEIISLVGAYEEAASGSEAQAQASAKLAEALGLEGDAVNTLAEDYEKLTAAKAAQSTVDASDALAAAEDALVAQNKFSWKLGVVAFDASMRNKEIDDIINRNLKDFSSEVDFENGLGVYRTSRDANIREILDFYNALEKTINEVKEAEQGLEVEDQKAISRSAKMKSLLSTYEQLTENVTGYRDAYKGWFESRLTETYFEARSNGFLDTQEQFDSYRETLEEIYKREEDLAIAQETLDKMFPQFSGYIDEATAALAEEEAQLASTTSAIDRYKKAMGSGEGSKGEKDDNFNTVAGAFATMQKEAKKKRYGSNAFQESASLVLGEDYIEKHGRDRALERMNELNKMGLFKEGSAGQGLYNLISQSENAEKVAEGYYQIAGGLAEVKKNADGTFDFNITDDPEGVLKVANALEISATSLLSIAQAAGVFDPNIDVDALQELINKIDDIDAKVKDEKKLLFSTNDTEVIGQIDEVQKKAEETAKQYVMDFLANLTLSFSGDASNNFGKGGHGGGGGMTYEKQATGTSNFKGGLTWVNDEAGGFNPELIETGGKSFFVNGGRPALVSLPKGTIIHNATETRKLFASDFMEVPHFKDGIEGNGIPLGLRERSGRVAGVGNGKGSAGSKDWWEKLQQYMEDLLEKAGDALDKQLEAIDAELFYLQYGKEVSEKATKLEEARMDLLEAEQELINAQTERTVRYFNAETGQWEWMADQKDILKAQEDLADKQKDYLKAQYDYLEDVWEDLKDDIQKAIDGKKDVNIANVLKQMMKSKAGGLTGNVEGVIGDLLNLITALSNGTALDTYDSGGIASGLGYMYKATKADEVVLNGGLSNAILSPKRSQQFADFTSSLERMFGMASMMERPQSRMGWSTNDNHSTNVYMNGIKIGSDMLNRPLSEVLSVLPIYCN